MVFKIYKSNDIGKNVVNAERNMATLLIKKNWQNIASF